VAGTAASDLARWALDSQVAAYGLVFAVEAVLFVAAALLALRIALPARAPASPVAHPVAEPPPRGVPRAGETA
jgi:BCD family chlorophyll transporter-like MFS transporter